MEFHDICPSYWADFCRFTDMPEKELHSIIVKVAIDCYCTLTLLLLKIVFRHGQTTPSYVTHPWILVITLWQEVPKLCMLLDLTASVL